MARWNILWPAITAIFLLELTGITNLTGLFSSDSDTPTSQDLCVLKDGGCGGQEEMTEASIEIKNASVGNYTHTPSEEFETFDLELLDNGDLFDEDYS